MLGKAAPRVVRAEHWGAAGPLGEAELPQPPECWLSDAQRSSQGLTWGRCQGQAGGTRLTQSGPTFITLSV